MGEIVLRLSPAVECYYYFVYAATNSCNYVNIFLQWDTNRNLAWVKNVRETHGSVEVNALSQVEAINSRGFYTIGNFTNKNTVKVFV